MIRLAVRCTPEQAEIVLAELTVLAPNGVEEERGPGYVEYAIYGGEGELPELGEIEVAAGDGLVEVVATEVPDDWADRWQDFHKPLLVGERLWLRPSWEEPREGTIDLVVDPGRAFGTGAHPTTRLCLELLLELPRPGEASGPLTDLGTGSGVLAIAAAKLGWDPVRGYDHEEPAIEAATANAAANGVSIELEQPNLREGLPDARPDRRRQHDRAGPEGGRRAARSGGSRGEGLAGASPLLLRRDPPPTPRTPGLLRSPPGRARRDRRRLRPRRPDEADRRLQGDWARSLLAAAPVADMFRRRCVLATIVDPGYKFALFLHILAVVLAFGPTFGYALFFSVAPQFPRATPAILAGVQKVRSLSGQPRDDRPAAGGDLPARPTATGRRARRSSASASWRSSSLFGLQHAFFQPQTRKARELAERDLKAGDTLSDEFNAVSERLGKVGGLAGLIVVVTIFFMTYKPFL